jgi:hypothetical protein
MARLFIGSRYSHFTKSGLYGPQYIREYLPCFVAFIAQAIRARDVVQKEGGDECKLFAYYVNNGLHYANEDQTDRARYVAMRWLDGR